MPTLDPVLLGIGAFLIGISDAARRYPEYSTDRVVAQVRLEQQFDLELIHRFPLEQWEKRNPNFKFLRKGQGR